MQYIILLRGINVGGRTIKMAELKMCFEKAAYQRVVTVLQTGNVIIESKEKNINKLQKDIESLLESTFHYPAKILAISQDKLEEVIQKNPFKNQDTDFHRYVVFTEKGFEKEIVKQAGELDKSMEDISAGKGVIYWRVFKGHTLDSSFGKYMAKVASRHFMTNRNLNTLEKILVKGR